MSATERDDPRVDPDGGEGTVHCAVHNSQETPETDPKVRRRARAREGSGESAQSQPGSAPRLDLAKPPAPVTWSDHIWGVVSGFSPPDIWSQDRPSLSQVWAYAARGDWTGQTGLPRRAGQAYAVLVAVPAITVAYLLAWTAERPSRLIAAVVLLALLSRVPPLAWLI